MEVKPSHEEDSTTFIYLFYMYLVTYLSTLLVDILHGVKLYDKY